jgi:hypothetical protein
MTNHLTIGVAQLVSAVTLESNVTRLLGFIYYVSRYI